MADPEGIQTEIEPFQTGEGEEQMRLFLAVDKAGIDTSIFKAHSTRGAATSAAAAPGITTADILKAADWSSESVFTKFYYKPLSSSVFGEAVLSNSRN